MKGTKLWTEAGSPLIRGRSRAQTPLGRELLIAWTLVAALAAGGVWWFLGSKGGGGLAGLWPVIAAAVVLGGLLAWFAVWMGRRMGLRSPWVAGVLVGALGAFAGAAGYLYASVGLFGT